MSRYTRCQIFLMVYDIRVFAKAHFSATVKHMNLLTGKQLYEELAHAGRLLTNTQYYFVHFHKSKKRKFISAVCT